MKVFIAHHAEKQALLQMGHQAKEKNKTKICKCIVCNAIKIVSIQKPLTLLGDETISVLKYPLISLLSIFQSKPSISSSIFHFR